MPPSARACAWQGSSAAACHGRRARAREAPQERRTRQAGGGCQSHVLGPLGARHTRRLAGGTALIATAGPPHGQDMESRHMARLSPAALPRQCRGTLPLANCTTRRTATGWLRLLTTRHAFVSCWRLHLTLHPWKARVCCHGGSPAHNLGGCDAKPSRHVVPGSMGQAAAVGRADPGW